MGKYGLFFIGLVSLVSAQNIIQLPDSLRAPADTLQWVKRVPQYCEGPVWEPSTGAVYFTDQRTGNIWPIWKIRPGIDTGGIFFNSQKNNGLELDPQGRLISCQNGQIGRIKSDATLDSVLTLSGGGITIGQANDLSIGSNGAIYFTDLATSVFYLSPNRQLSRATTNISSANGIEWMESENMVYVNSTSGNAVYKFAIGTPGVLGTRTTYVASPGPDGGTYDSHGNRYIASYTQGEVRVFNARGDSIGRIALRTATGTYDNRAGNQGNVDNCVFGGSDLKTLYITGDGGLYSIQLKIAGQPRYATSAIHGISFSKQQGLVSKNTYLDALGRPLVLKSNRRNIPSLHWK